MTWIDSGGSAGVGSIDTKFFSLKHVAYAELVEADSVYRIRFHFVNNLNVTSGDSWTTISAAHDAMEAFFDTRGVS
jgi:hypothetical protein